MIRLLFCFIITGLLAGCSLMPQPAPTSIVLFRASIDDIREGPPYPASTQPNVMDINSYFFVDYDLHEILIGHLKLQRGTALTVAWHMPMSDREPPLQFYILARQDSEGKLRTILWKQVHSGFCLPQDIAVKIGIENEMRKLYQSGEPACKNLTELGYGLTKK
ncbi:hypothetical protein ACO0LC_10435 [Undibacterium sp. JH2W]|uniref:hypothetical protein n=1 Tax=Undibacterium sp. JH2W TaxID=3413037 RepID=UPI003BF3AD6A